MATSLFNKIIWAIDPTKDPNQARYITQELRTWSSKLNLEVLPVYVFPKKSLSSSLSLEGKPSWNERFDQVIEASLLRYLKKVKCSDFLHPKVLTSVSDSTRVMALTLADYALKQRAPLVFVSTRAKQTWNPFRLGGFAETLAASSRVPVLVMNSTARPSGKQPQILFPTDLGRESKAALGLLGPWAKALGADVRIYNQVETLVPYQSEFYGLAAGSQYKDLTKSYQQAREKRARAWASSLSKKQVNCETLVRPQQKYLANEIGSLEKKMKAGLIAMASHSGTLTQALLGSVAHDVLLQAKCPVIIFHRPKAQRKNQELVLD